MKRILLNIGFDYFSNGSTGVGAYQANIIWGIGIPYDIIVPPNYDIEKLPSYANPIVLNNGRKKIIKILKLFVPIHVIYKNYDIVINGSNCFKRSKKVKQISIVHDLMCSTEPKSYSLKQRFHHLLSVKSLHNADRIIAVSQCTKQAIHDICKIPFERIFVLPNVTDFYIANKPEDFFMFIGDMRRTKNLSSLVYGFAEYRKKYGGKNKLLIAGNKKYEYNNLKKIVNKLCLEDKVIFTGYINESQKKALYEHTKGLVFLSDNEGFGIPLLEAGVNEIPVLCSDIPVFHEIMNTNMAIFVNNKDHDCIATGLLELNKFVTSKSDAELLKNKYSRETFNSLLQQLIGE